jgi:DNA polymerase-3 subunit delta
MPDGPLVLVHGDDEFAVSQRARQIYNAWCGELNSIDHDIIEATVATAAEASVALGQLREAIETFPLFSGAKVVWFKNCNFLGDDRTAKAKDVSSGLTDFASLVKSFEWAGVRLLISANKTDKRKTFYKTISKVGCAESFEALNLNDRDWQAKAEKVVTSKLKALKKNADYEAVAELTRMVGPNARALISECEKVAMYVGKHDKVEVGDVRAIVIRGKHAKAFALGDALGERDLPRLLKRLDEDLWEVKTDRKKSVIGLVGGLVSKVRSLLFARELLDAGWLKPTRSFPQFKPQIDRLPANSFPADRKISPLGLHPYVLFNAVNQACNYNSVELVRALELLMHCNRHLVSSSLDDTLILQQTLTQIVVRKAKAA